MSLCYAQSQVAPPAQMASDETTDGEPTEQALVELNFPTNLDLRVLIDYVSERLGINILYDEQVANKKISVKAPRSVPIDSLMGILEGSLRMKGLAIVDTERSGWKRVVQVRELAAISDRITDAAEHEAGHEVVTQVFELQFVQPTHAEQVLKPFLTQPGGNVLSIHDRNVLVVTDFAASMARLAALVERIDRPATEVTVQFIPITHVKAPATASQLGELLAAQAKVQGKSGDPAAYLHIAADNRTNQLIIIGDPSWVRLASETVASLDVPLALTTEAYRFSIVSPERVDRLTRELIDPQDLDRLYRSTMDVDAGLLIVTTTAAIHERVATLQTSLDVMLPAEQSPIRIYKLKNADAQAVLETIRAIEGQDGFRTVDLDPGVDQAWSDTDSRPVQVTETPPYEPSKRSPELVDSTGLHEAVHTDRSTVTYDPNTNSIIVIADPATQHVYEQLIGMLDQRRPQVLVEATIVTIDTTDDFALGVELARQGTVTIGGDEISTLFFSQFGLSTLNPDSGRPDLEPGLGFNGVLLSTDIADVVIRALKSNGRSTVMSAPKLLVNDNATGTIDSINEAPYASINASNTVSTTSFGGFISAGTQITITPHIAEGDHLRLEFEIALNSFTGDSTNGLPPPRQTNSIQSEVTIPDGQTIVVGGLNRIDESSAKQAVPFLGAIPGLEYLFSSRTEGKRNATLFVFIRPVILRDDLFRDLKYFSARDRNRADIMDPAAAPLSSPILVR